MRAVVFLVMLLMMPVAGETGMTQSFMRGSALLTYCESQAGGDQQGCLAYLMAVSDSINDNKANFPNANHPVYYTHNDTCPPDSGLVANQLKKVWVKWANEHPEKLHMAVYGLVMEAFAQAWPCN